jgi:hypothetical protein
MLAGESLERYVARGCLQGGVLSPLLWSLVVDELIGLNGNGWNMQMSLLSLSAEKKTVSELLQEALSMVQQWCDRTQLSINPQKTVIVPFTQQRDLRDLKEPTLSRHTLQLTTDVKYLGLFLEKGLTWKAQLKNVILQHFLDL